MSAIVLAKPCISGILLVVFARNPAVIARNGLRVLHLADFVDHVAVIQRHTRGEAARDTAQTRCSSRVYLRDRCKDIAYGYYATDDATRMMRATQRRVDAACLRHCIAALNPRASALTRSRARAYLLSEVMISVHALSRYALIISG